MTEQERKAPLDMKDITVDVGAVSKEEAVESSAFVSVNR